MLIADADPTLTHLLTLIPSLSGSAILALVTYGFLSGKIVRKGELDKAEANAQKWEAVALRLMTSTERAAGAAERATSFADKVIETANRSPP